MEIDVHDDKKIVCVWLAKAESADPMTQEKLKPLYEKYRKRKYMVAVFHSGDGDLEELTRDLIRYNRRLFAEREVQAEKRRASRER